MKNKNRITHNFCRSLLSSAILISLGISQAHAMAIETGNSDISIRFDNTVRLSYGQRVENRDASIAQTVNYNDGDLKFATGDAVNQRLDLLSELDFVYKDTTGFRLSGAGWYDHAYADNSDELSDFADRYYHGPSGELLDAFVFYNAEVGDALLNVKLGRHTLFWGETLFNAANGINYGQSALDLGKLYTVPGSSTKELFIPRNQLSASLTLSPELTLGAQYFLAFNHSRFPEGGTYWGPYDMALDGGSEFFLPMPPASYLNVPRGQDVTPDDTGDFGLMASWSPQWLDGSLGFYYRRTSDSLPFLLVDASNGLGSANYFTTYGSDIDLYGLSLATSVGPVSVGVDINYRQNMTLASNFGLVNSTYYSLGQAGVINGANIIANKPNSGETGLARGDTLHAVVNGMVIFGDTPLWDSSVLAVEGALTHLVKVTEGEESFKGAASYQGIDKVTTNTYSLAAKFTPTWYQVTPGLDLSLPISVNFGLSGNSAVQFGGNEDAGSYSIGLSGDLHQKYKFDLQYIDAFGPYKTCSTGSDNNTPGTSGSYACIPGQITSQAGLAPLLKDRGMIMLSFKTTF